MKDNEKRVLIKRLHKLRNQEVFAEGRYQAEKLKLKGIRAEIAAILEDLGDDG